MSLCCCVQKTFTRSSCMQICCVAVVILISSCGFKLRTAAVFPAHWEPLYIVSVDKFDDIEQAISLSLARYNIAQGESANAHSRLEIVKERKTIQDTLVQATNTRQLTLTWEFRFDVFDTQTGKWKRLITKNAISESINFGISGSVSESNPEFRDLILEVREELVESMLRLLSQIRLDDTDEM